MKYELMLCLIIFSLNSNVVPTAAIKISKSINILQSPQQVNNLVSEPHNADYQSLDEGSDKAVPLSWSPSVGTMQDEKRELKQLAQFNAELEASLKREGDSETSNNDEDDPRNQKRISDDIRSKVMAIKEEIKRDASLKHDRHNQPTADIMMEGDVDDEKEDRRVMKHHSRVSSNEDRKSKLNFDKERNEKNHEDDRNSDKLDVADNLDQREGSEDDLFKDPHDKENNEKNKQTDEKNQSDDNGDNSECSRSWPRPKAPPGRKDSQLQYTDHGKNEPDSKQKGNTEDIERSGDSELTRHSEDTAPLLHANHQPESSNMHAENTAGRWEKRSEDDSNTKNDLAAEKKSLDSGSAVADTNEANNNEEQQQEEEDHEEQPEDGGEDIDLGLLDIVQTIHALRKRDAVYDRLFGGNRREKRSSNNDQRNRRRENYLRDLEDSFPNPNSGSDTEQDSLEPHVRVKRHDPVHVLLKSKNTVNKLI